MNLIIALVNPVPYYRIVSASLLQFVNLFIVSYRKSRSSQSLDSCNQNPDVQYITMNISAVQALRFIDLVVL